MLRVDGNKEYVDQAVLSVPKESVILRRPVECIVSQGAAVSHTDQNTPPKKRKIDQHQSSDAAHSVLRQCLCTSMPFHISVSAILQLQTGVLSRTFLLHAVNSLIPTLLQYIGHADNPIEKAISAIQTNLDAFASCQSCAVPDVFPQVTFPVSPLRGCVCIGSVDVAQSRVKLSFAFHSSVNVSCFMIGNCGNSVYSQRRLSVRRLFSHFEMAQADELTFIDEEFTMGSVDQAMYVVILAGTSSYRVGEKVLLQALHKVTKSESDSAAKEMAANLASFLQSSSDPDFSIIVHTFKRHFQKN
jgi:hypothetical protein